MTAKMFLWALPKGKTDRLEEHPMTSFALTAEQADKVQAAAALEGWHGFRRVTETNEVPDFVAGIRGVKKRRR